jgi:hypothetical protein
VGAQIPPIAGAFLARQPLVVVGAADERDSLWSTLLTGRPGFARVLDERNLVVEAGLPEIDPLHGAFDSERDIGMLAIEPASRRRMRINGRGWRDASGLRVRTEQVYANCPKYIQTRTLREHPQRSAMVASRSTELSDEQRRWIAAADTFFVATAAQGKGADVSHRGGNPGFLSVEGSRITWPDYVGNSMFMTLGNHELDPRAGLLFLDFREGHALHVTGLAETDWDAQRIAAFPGAQRLVDFEVAEVRQVDHRTPFTWSLERYSKFNPDLSTVA